MKQIPGRHTPFVLILSIILVAAVAVAAPTWLGFESEEEGVRAIYNPEAPVQAEVDVIEPEQMWRIGGDDDPAGTLLGLITDAAVDEDGVAYILDSTLSTVLAVAPDGEILRSVGREGDGPGEFRAGQELEMLPGGVLGVMELMPSRLVVMDRQGIPVPGWRLGGDGVQTGMNHVRHLESVGNGLVVGLVSTRFEEGKVTITNRLGRIDKAGNQTAIYLETSREQSGGAISISIGGGDDFAGNFTTMPDGRVVVFQKAREYKLEVFGRDGLERIIRREYQPLRRSDDDIEDAREQAEAMRARFGEDEDGDVQEFERDVSQVVARPNGELWVLSSRGVRDCPAAHVGAFDVFDADGHYVRTTRIAADYDSKYDNFQIVGNRLFVFKEAQNSPDRTFSGGGGGATTMMVIIGGGDEEEEDDREPMPYEVICYRLSD